MHPICLMILQNLHRQVRFAYMLIPIVLYLILYIFYASFHHYMLGQEVTQCQLKTPLVQWDLYIFDRIYSLIRESHNKVITTLCAVPYIAHFGSPGIYLLVLLVKKPGWRYFWLYALSLGLTSVTSILLQYFLPTAPPWIMNDLPPEAKFYLVDEMLSHKLFHSIYGANKVICGAFPSIHVQWPMVMALNGYVHPCFGIGYVLWIVVAAIYSEHHWISDVLVGLTIAIISTWLAKRYVSGVEFEKGAQQEVTADVHTVQTAVTFQANIKV